MILFQNGFLTDPPLFDIDFKIKRLEFELPFKILRGSYIGLLWLKYDTWFRIDYRLLAIPGKLAHDFHINFKFNFFSVAWSRLNTGMIPWTKKPTLNILNSSPESIVKVEYVHPNTKRI